MNPFRRFLNLFTKSARPAELLPAWRRGVPQWPTWDGKKAIKEGLKLSTVVYACTKLRSECLASLPWYVETLQGDGEWERVNGDPLEMLLAYPNEYQSRQTVFETISLQLDLVGNALLNKVLVSDLRTGTQIPSELWVIDPTNVQPIPDQQRFISGYQYIDGERRIIDASEVIHIQFPDPAWPYWGLSPLQAAAKSVDTQTEAVRWNMNALQNRGMPDVHFSTDAELDQDSYEQIMGRIANAYNSPDNARRPIVTGNGFTAEVVNWKPIEMDFINSMQFYREDGCMAYGVPLTMIQVLQDATLANAEALEAGFWRNTMIPYADLVQSALNVGLIPRAQRGQRRICYDLAGVKVLAEDMDKKVTQYATLVGAAVSPNAARKFLKMDLEDEVNGGDMAFIPATLVPLEDAQSIANEPTVTAQPRIGGGKAEELAEEIKTMLIEGKDERLALPPAAMPVAPEVNVTLPTVRIQNVAQPTSKRMSLVPIRGPAGEIIRYEVEQTITYEQE